MPQKGHGSPLGTRESDFFSLSFWNMTQDCDYYHQWQDRLYRLTHRDGVTDWAELGLIPHTGQDLLVLGFLRAAYGRLAGLGTPYVRCAGAFCFASSLSLNLGFWIDSSSILLVSCS